MSGWSCGSVHTPDPCRPSCVQQQLAELSWGGGAGLFAREFLMIKEGVAGGLNDEGRCKPLHTLSRQLRGQGWGGAGQGQDRGSRPNRHRGGGRQYACTLIGVHGVPLCVLGHAETLAGVLARLDVVEREFENGGSTAAGGSAAAAAGPPVEAPRDLVRPILGRPLGLPHSFHTAVPIAIGADPAGSEVARC